MTTKIVINVMITEVTAVIVIVLVFAFIVYYIVLLLYIIHDSEAFVKPPEKNSYILP